ncbi:MAG: PIG-L deacetylase family protein [Candidatus Helarchaeota archaeon]
MKGLEHLAIFAAHPDDEGAVWAILCKYSEYGNRISIIWMTYGDRFIAPVGKYVHYLPLLIKAIYKENIRERLSRRIKSIRKKEALKAANLIKATPYFLEFKDTKIPDPINFEAVQKITNLIRKIRPSIILTHFFREGHRDHRNTSALITKAYLLSKDENYKLQYPPHQARIFGFWSERGRGFKPNFYLNVTNQINKISEWGKCYESQRFRIVGRFAKFIAKYNGRRTPYSYVEKYRIFGTKISKNFGEFFP